MNAEEEQLVNKWGYDPKRASEYPSHDRECTRKQAKYIEYLATKQPELAWELEQLINLFTGEGRWNALTVCTKGQAMFVIKCFLGEICPKE